MQLSVSATKAEMAQAAATKAAGVLREAIERNGTATFIAATGASQFEFLEVSHICARHRLVAHDHVSP